MMSDERDLMPLLEGMAEAAAGAVRLLRAEFPVSPVDTNDWGEFKAAFDVAEAPAVAFIRGRLADLRPDASWRDELGGDVGEEYFLLDTLDGAVQYLNALPYWAVSITYVKDGEPTAAVIHNSTDDQYLAVRGGGATRNGNRIQPSQKTVPALALVATNQPPFVAQNPDAITAAASALSSLLPVVGVVRNFGPTSWQVANVASGHLDGFYQYGSDPANLAAGALVAAEAGARLTTVDGAAWTLESASILIAAPALHAQLLQSLNASPTTEDCAR